MDVATGTDLVLACVDERGVAWLTLNDPGRHNVISLEMQRAITPLLAAFDADPVIRALVVRGGGESAFCAGANISELPDRTASDGRIAEFARTLADFWQAWRDLDKPIVAMIRGHCVGGGLLLALQADVRLCSDDSTFAVPAAKLGAGYGLDVVDPLLEVVGAAWTAELLFSARTLNAKEALSAGFVNRVVTVGELAHATGELATAIASNAPLAVATIKAAIREARKPGEHRDRARVEMLVAACLDSADFLEGKRAFREKRPPVFEGR